MHIMLENFQSKTRTKIALSSMVYFNTLPLNYTECKSNLIILSTKDGSTRILENFDRFIQVIFSEKPIGHQP